MPRLQIQIQTWARIAVASAALVATLAIPFAAPVSAQSLELDTVEFFSPAVDRAMKYNIVLPRGYDESTQRYPVLYLLHGLTQNYTAWGLSNGTPFYAGLYDDLIVVMPDAGNSWYVNWTADAGGQKNNWEDHIITDVINHVDWNFRTIARREGRAISGLSMGGYGAITLGLRHPDMFISIGSTSGALEHARQIARRMRGESPPRQAQQRTAAEQAERAARLRRPNPLIGIDGFSSQVERSPDGQEFPTPEDADAYDPFTLIAQLDNDVLPHIYLDCGTEDRLIGGARELASILMERDVPFDYMQMQGRHNAAYWIQSIGRISAVQYEVMQRALGQRPSGRRRASSN
ncbi:MAG: alpha/beta hydrolase-fold protein [Vicinamibacterales bacterium]|nr:alpha/beta hydrolase-fold protein [Vicinamibacterales bacterium]